LQTTASKVSSEKERACASSTKNGSIERFAEALARYLGHGGGYVACGDVTGRADCGEGRLGRKPYTGSNVKDAHTSCNAGRAQNGRHEVSRNMRKGSVVLGRRLPLKDEFRHRNLAIGGRKIAASVGDGKSFKPTSVYDCPCPMRHFALSTVLEIRLSSPNPQALRNRSGPTSPYSKSLTKMPSGRRGQQPREICFVIAADPASRSAASTIIVSASSTRIRRA
jgi:hypothetical protein